MGLELRRLPLIVVTRSDSSVAEVLLGNRDRPCWWCGAQRVLLLGELTDASKDVAGHLGRVDAARASSLAFADVVVVLQRVTPH